MSSKSPYEKEIEVVKSKLKNPLLTDNDEWGPRKFVDTILEYDLDDKPESIFKRICVGNLKLESLKELENPWKEIYILYIRAFQSMHSKTVLKKFVIAINDGLFTENINLSKIDIKWCNQEFNLYGQCWLKITPSKKHEREEILGRTLVNKILQAFGVTVKLDKEMKKIIDRMIKHKPTLTLLGRLAKLMNTDNTSELLNDAIAHGQAMYSSGELDMAKITRSLIKSAQKGGIQTDKITAFQNMAKLLGK